MNWGVYLAHGCGVVNQSEGSTIPYHQMQEQQYDDDDDDLITSSHYHNINDNIYNNNYQKLINRLENALMLMGLSRFSYTIAIQYIISKIESGQHQKIQHVILYLISLLNNKNNNVKVNNNKKIISTTDSRLENHHVNNDDDINSTTRSNNNIEEDVSNNNRCPQFIPGLTAKPFWDPNQFEWIAILEASYNDIKKEFMALRPTTTHHHHQQQQHQHHNHTCHETQQQQQPQQQQQYPDTNHDHSNINDNDNIKTENRNILSSGFQHYRSPKPTINTNIDNTSTTTSTTDTTNTSTTTTSPLSNRSMNATDNNNSYSNSHHNNIDELGTVATDSGHWNVCYFYLHDMDYHENLRKCPITAQSINNIPRHYHHALFSALAPNTHIIPHYGPTNKKLRIHLPLFVPTIDNTTNDDDDHKTVDKKIPKNPWIRVGNEYKIFHEGKCIIFDDSFEHEVYNTSLLYPRIVLIIDIWHPDLTNEEIHFFNFLNKLQIKAAKKISHIINSKNKCENNINQNDDRKGTDDTLLDHHNHHQSKTTLNSINANIKMHDNNNNCSQEDFYHIIQTGKEKGIEESDINNIWM
jgi:aspartyl/asparaginyl beta-hydroxylase (cupin superfamily)